MITAPLLTTGITVDLPSTESKALLANEPITITITSDENIFIGEILLKEPLLVTLNAITGIEKESRILPKADEKLPYGKVMQIIV